MVGPCKGTEHTMFTRTETYDGAHHLPEGQRWTLRLIFLTVSLTRKETYDGAHQLPEGQTWTQRLIFLNGELIKSNILASKRKIKNWGTQSSEEDDHVQLTVSEEVVHVQLQLNPPGEGSAVFKIMNTCSYNTTPLGKRGRF